MARGLANLVLCFGCTCMAADQPVKERFVGSWDLVSYELRMPSGEIRYPFGNDPLGRISYDAEGHMSAQLMRRNRPNPPAGASGITGYSGYYGMYTVDEKAGIVTHHVQGAWAPSWIGTGQVRYYKFEGDRLTLEGDLSGGRVKLVWQRVH